MLMQYWPQTCVVRVCKMFPLPFPLGTPELIQWLFVISDPRSASWKKTSETNLNVQGKAFILNSAGIKETKEIFTDKVRTKVTTPKLSESVKFHVHSSVCCGNKCYDYIDLKQKSGHLDISVDNSLGLKKVKVVVGQDHYLLLFLWNIQKPSRMNPELSTRNFGGH